MGHPLDVERASQMHMDWCLALIERASLATTHQAGPQMRAVMHELRASLSPDAVLAIANLFPALERGIFLEGWTLGAEPQEVPDEETFFRRVYQRVKQHHEPPRSIVSDVFAVWEAKLGPVKADLIRSRLPPALTAVWPKDAGNAAPRATASTG